MSSYGASDAWDGGPPGAEAEYATQRAPPLSAPMPTTDPWTGVSYSSYGQPHYDYQHCGPSGYGFSYDSGVYSHQCDDYYKYPDPRNTFSTLHSSYDYSKLSESTSSPAVKVKEEHRQMSYRSYSRSVSPYERRSRSYSMKKDPCYEKTSRKRSRSISKLKHTKSFSEHSRSRSNSRSPLKKRIKKRTSSSSSSESSNSEKLYKKRSSDRSDHSMTPPLKKYKSQSSNCPRRSVSHRNYSKESSSDNKEKVRSKGQSYTSKEKMQKEHLLPRKGKDRLVTPPKSQKRLQRSLTPPRKYESRKVKDGSIMHPRCYTRRISSSSSDSRSASYTPKHKNRSSSNSNYSRSKRCSSHSSRTSRRSRSRPKYRKYSNLSTNHRSRSNSRSKCYSRSKSRSKSRRRSSSEETRRHSNSTKSKSRRRSSSEETRRHSNSTKSKSHSRSCSSDSHYRSGTHSDDERRGQFTVADRKRFWKMHRSRQEEREKDRTPKEVKAPPGALESTTVDDIKYGDPPEVEGPNFAELLPPPDEMMQQTNSTSKSKPMPIPIKNDGSFLEMFKKMQEESKKSVVPEKQPVKKPMLAFIGKRRGGRVLKTGLVKKAKAIEEQTVDNTPKDAWSLYMQEVKKYRETSCEEERKTRPLVK